MAGSGKLRGLVVHQGDERANDEGGAFAGECGQLVTEALAGAGGHNEEDVSAGGRGEADSFLVGAEVGKTEGLVEKGAKIHDGGLA